MILTNIQSCKDWFFSDTPSDVTVEAGGTSFAIHKFPMASKCGRMRRLFAEADDHTDVPLIHLHEMPGGANAFELVAKFCYGINPQITPSNVAMLRCAAHYLEMTQDDGDELNLESLTEAYLKDAIITDSANSITVLMNTCENLLPLAEELDIVNRCIDTIVSETCKELTNTSRSVYSRLLSDVPSDVTVEAGGTNFALHKFPLVSRSGRIRKLLTESREPTKVYLQDMPGGADAFELAAKFCYGVNVEITVSNVAMLRCAASYLEMTENYGEGSLEARTEAYLTEIVTQNLADSVTVLHSCENLLPFAEDLKIIGRCIDGITSNACKEQLSSGLSRLQYSGSAHRDNQYQIGLAGNFCTTTTINAQQLKPHAPEWWGKELTVLNIHMFQRVLTAMKSRGLSQDIVSGALMNYAQNSLEGFSKIIRDPQMSKPKAKPRDFAPTLLEREQRSVIETVVSLLPPVQGKNSGIIPVSFLSGLLRTAIMLNATASCRMELEKRIGFQLDQATLDDILIPTFISYGEDYTLFDTDVVHRIVTNFLQLEAEELADGMMHIQDITAANYESDGLGSPNQSATMKVSKLMDSYLAEIAPDRNLSVSKFIGLAEVLQDNGRVVDDGLYRAIDICLKAHPTATDVERKKLCKLIDCQRLSQEACTHAAKNERLPIHVVVRVLYFEQLRLRNDMQSGSFYRDGDNFRSNCSPQLMNNIGFRSSMDNYESIRLENREMRLEFVRLRIRLTDVEKECLCMKQMMVKSSSTNRFMNSFSRNLTKFQSLFREGVHILQFSKSTHHHRPQQTASSHSGQLASLSGRRL